MPKLKYDKVDKVIKKKIFIIALYLFCVFTMTSCLGYNAIMYRHLSSEENYGLYEVAVEKIYVSKKETGKLEEYDAALHDDSYLNGTVYFGVSAIGGFYGGNYLLENGDKTELIVLLQVISENSRLLVNSGFYNNFTAGDTIEMQASNLVYMDTNYYYVIGVKYDGVQYLNSEDGLKNIVAMMDNNRSLF